MATNANDSKKTEDKKTTSKKTSTDKTSGKDEKAVKKSPAKK